jgi:TonB family protein
MPDWRQCEGELAGGEFPLDRLLDGREGSAVFLTRFGSGRAVIKLVPAGEAQAAEFVERWNRAASLRHPNLVRILAAGTCEMAGTPLAYLAMEYAEENLAEVLRERPLTTDEARDMLAPVADALAYLHDQGLVHGNLKPSNILAVEDTVKISSEAVSAGDPAADLRALGVMLVQALTPPGGQGPAVDALPFPFREVAQNCQHDDPRLRWSAARTGDWLRSPERPAPAPPPPAAPAEKPVARKSKYRYYAAVAVLVVAGAIAVGLVMHRTAATEPSAVELSPPAPASVPSVPPPAKDGITRRVLPDIPALARNTIQGMTAVVVRVVVDPSGNVTRVTLEGGGSHYFGRLALAAARQWQFAPAQGAGPRNWTLRFEIMPTTTQVIPTRADRE